jgi:prolipoprotein diacylglyceryltransferase
MEFTLLGAAVVGLGAFYLAIRWDAARANAADCVRDHWDRALAAAISGVFVGRVVAMLIDGVNPISGDLLIVRAGVNTVAATIAAIVTVAWLGRTDLGVALDGLAGAALVGLAGWHAGCLVRDSCLGTVSDLPWALSQSSGAPTRHPVEIYAALLLVVAGVAVSLFRIRGLLRPYAPFALAVAAAGAVRLATEPVRLSLSGGPVVWYAIASAAGITGFVVAQRRVSAGASAAATD